MKLFFIHFSISIVLIFSAFAEETNKIGIFTYKVLNETTCTVAISPVPENAKSFPLDNPNRFVVDVPTKQEGKNSSNLIKSNCLTSIRLGIHKDYSRIVFDLAEGVLLKNFTHEKQTLTLNFESVPNDRSTSFKDIETSKVDTNPDLLTPTPSSTATPLPTITKSAVATLTSTPTLSPSQTAISIPTKMATIRATMTPTVAPLESPTQVVIPSPIPTHSPNQNSSTELTRLNSILFDTSKDHIVKFSFSNSPQYSMLKKGANLYWIIISNTQLGNEMVSKPYFAPQDFNGIVSVLAKVSNQDLILEITTDPQIQLFSFREGDSLLIKKE